MNTVQSPLPGKITKILVQNGDAISENTILLLLESMKMEIDIYSPYSGTVKEIKVKEGQDVESNEPMMIISMSN